MPRAIRLEEYGDADRMVLCPIDVAAPGPGQIRLRQTAIGVNFHDIYVRSGTIRTLALPGIPGLEAVGIVEAIGSGVNAISVGDRVGYVTSAYGGYAEVRLLDAGLAIRLPPALNDEQAAATLMKAMTVRMLLEQVRSIEAGETILVHAAAGGVGQLLCQWARWKGARIIGTVGSAAKADVARAAGADDIILYREENVAERVRTLTAGEGVAVVYDSIGADTFQSSIEALAFQGHLAIYGQASGPVAPFAPALLAARSLSVSRPIIFHYIRTPAMLADMERAVFAAFAAGAIKPIDPVTMPLSEAARAHDMLEAKQSPGGIVLVP